MALIASRGIGGAGTMEIHDDGWTVMMRVRSADGQTNSGALPWRAIINGGWTPNANGQFGGVHYPSGSPWVVVGQWGLGASQTVTFEIGNTGTWGFGGGGSLSAYINRTPPATVPPAPSQPWFDQIGHTTARVMFNGNGDGGSAITTWQIAVSTSPAFGSGTMYFDSSGTTTLSVLKPGTTYYVMARGWNGIGAGPWSAVNSFRTLAGIRVKVAGQWREAVPMVKVAGVWRDVIPYVRSGGQWKPMG